MRTLPMLAAEVSACTRCRLGETRTNIVFGRGNPSAKVMLLGEAPGAKEDEAGEPFVGDAGRMLGRLQAEVGITDTYLCNVVKCRPPDNRKPQPDEMDACRPYLEEQIALVGPRVLVALGTTAIQAVLGPRIKLKDVRGQWQTYKGIDVMPTFHPAYLFRVPAARADMLADLRAVVARLDVMEKRS